MHVLNPKKNEQRRTGVLKDVLFGLQFLLTGPVSSRCRPVGGKHLQQQVGLRFCFQLCEAPHGRLIKCQKPFPLTVFSWLVGFVNFDVNVTWLGRFSGSVIEEFKLSLTFWNFPASVAGIWMPQSPWLRHFGWRRQPSSRENGWQ